MLGTLAGSAGCSWCHTCYRTEVSYICLKMQASAGAHADQTFQPVTSAQLGSCQAPLENPRFQKSTPTYHSALGQALEQHAGNLMHGQGSPAIVSRNRQWLLIRKHQTAICVGWCSADGPPFAWRIHDELRDGTRAYASQLNGWALDETADTDTRIRWHTRAKHMKTVVGRVWCQLRCCPAGKSWPGMRHQGSSLKSHT